jgi:predicted nucleic acid-binding protein
MKNWKEEGWMTLIGCDTGYFVELLKGNDEAMKVWKRLIEDTEEVALVSSLTLFELERLALKGKIRKDKWNVLSNAIGGICKIGWINNKDILSVSARLSHGLGIPSIDSLILSWFVISDAKVIYTTDAHFENYKKRGVKIINFKT